MVAGSTQRKQRPSGFPAVPDRLVRQVLLAPSFANVLRGTPAALWLRVSGCYSNALAACKPDEQFLQDSFGPSKYSY